MNDNKNFDVSYSDYFDEKIDDNDSNVENYNEQFNVKNTKKDEKEYTYQNIEESIPIESTFDYGADSHQWVAEDNIATIDHLGELIRKLLDTAWGNEWGMFGSEFKENINDNEMILPQITFDEYEREVSEKKGIKPIIQRNIIERDQEGKPTGDSFHLYKQWFDVLMEFNIYGKTKKEMRDYVNRFEMLLLVYMKHLKKKGVSEMVFLKYMSGSQSDKYNKDLDAHMGSLLYLVRLERTTKVKVSTLNKLEVEVNKKG